jgi:AraC-like DNA-binding protein
MAVPDTVRVVPAPVDGVFLTVSASTQHFAPHWHDAYGFGLLEHGGQRWRSRCGSVDAYSGAVINTNPGEVHDGRPLGGPKRQWRILSVPVPVMTSLLDREHCDVEIVAPVIDDPCLVRALRRLFQRMRHDPESASPPLAIEESIVEACVLLIARHGSAPFRVSDAAGQLDQVRERLADAERRVPSLTELATLAGLSKYQVLRAFRRRYGLPPHAWLLCLRAERARTLITHGFTLANTAACTGFADQSHMSRTFRRHYGYTPGAWQRAVALKKV